MFSMLCISSLLVEGPTLLRCFEEVLHWQLFLILLGLHLGLDPFDISLKYPINDWYIDEKDHHGHHWCVSARTGLDLNMEPSRRICARPLITSTDNVNMEEEMESFLPHATSEWHLMRISASALHVNPKPCRAHQQVLLFPSSTLKTSSAKKSNAIFALTLHGGHLGFFEGAVLFPQPLTWMDKVIVGYANAMCQYEKQKPPCQSPCTEGKAWCCAPSTPPLSSSSLAFSSAAPHCPSPVITVWPSTNHHPLPLCSGRPSPGL